MLIWDAETLKKINSLEVDTFFLYDIYFDNTQEPLRYTNYSENFTFGGKVYTAVAIKSSEFTTTIEGQINDITLSIGNANRIVQYYVENYQLSGKKIKIRQLFKGCNSFFEIDMVIKSISCTEKQVDFICGLGFDVFLMSVPKRTMLRDFCKWQFRDENCGYAGSDTICSKQFADCKRKGNIRNFGGFPAIVSNRIFV